MDSLALPWLAPVPDDFRAQVRALRDAPTWQPEVARHLSTCRLDLTRLVGLSRALKPGPHDLKLSVLSNASTELLVPALAASAPRHDIWLDVAAAPFGSFMQEALDPTSATQARRNDIVLLALDARAHDLTPTPGDEAAARQTVDAALARLHRLVAALQGATVIVQTLAQSPDALFGNLDATLPGSRRWLIDRFNRALVDAPPAGTLLLDVAALAAGVGLDRWHDATQWALGKFAFAHAAVPFYADHVCRLIMAARGKAKKCLVLDLDNTLWGGVIGDDGLEGIVLGQGSPVGEAHLAVQAVALELRARGIVLAVSSKNDEAVARRVFREHPEMLLREEHIAVFQANWHDKATNLRAIAETLQIGIDALVFLDDNPAERQQVRLALPAVGVPELPDAPEQFAPTLLAAGYFESVRFTGDDKIRAAQYQANSARAAALGDAGDLGDYLASLAMRAEFAPFDAVGRARITQLINKTNQFNLTTRRYSEAEVQAVETDPRAFGLQVRLADRFGDNGMVNVVICRQLGSDALIDTWLMSCRVLKRGLERQVLDVLAQCAAARGLARLVGVYRPSGKNGMVADHYATLGFTQASSDDADETTWMLDLAGFQPVAGPIEAVIDPALLRPAAVR